MNYCRGFLNCGVCSECRKAEFEAKRDQIVSDPHNALVGIDRVLGPDSEWFRKLAGHRVINETLESGMTLWGIYKGDEPMKFSYRGG